MYEGGVVMAEKLYDKKNNVSKYRAQKGWYQSTLAFKVDISKWVVNAVERGSIIPTRCLAERFADVLGCSVEDLFNLKNYRRGE